jgi:hypothetical protein
LNHRRRDGRHRSGGGCPPRGIARAAIRASEDLADLIRAIDAEAVVPDRFWSTFLDDVTIGDFPPR